jgi:ankyrin repeat protein
MNAGKCPEDHLKRIYKELRRRGVNPHDTDEMGRTALHYAVASNSIFMVDQLVNIEGVKVNQFDMQGHSALTSFAKGDALKT